MAEAELWDICGRKSSGPESREANRSSRRTRSYQRRLVMDAIRSAGRHGLTACEVEQALGLARSGVSARFSELKRQGAIQPIQQRRKTPAGGSARVYVAAELYRAVLDDSAAAEAISGPGVGNSSQAADRPATGPQSPPAGSPPARVPTSVGTQAETGQRSEASDERILAWLDAIEAHADRLAALMTHAGTLDPDDRPDRRATRYSWGVIESCARRVAGRLRRMDAEARRAEEFSRTAARRRSGFSGFERRRQIHDRGQ